MKEQGIYCIKNNTVKTTKGNLNNKIAERIKKLEENL